MTRVVISDLDGTLLPRGGSISRADTESFSRLEQAGCIRIIATGRSLYSAMQILPPEFPIDYLVFSSGAGTVNWKKKEIIHTSHLPEAECREIAGILWNYNLNFTVQREIPENHRFFYTRNYPLHEDFKRRLETYRGFGTPISAPEDIKGKATQFVIILDGQQLSLMEEIRTELKRWSVVRTTSPIDNRAIWLEIFRQGTDKGRSCLRLLDRLGIAPAECAGIGNDYNDVDFLRICGQAYVVENAPDRLRAYYKSVASDRNNGFTDFVSRLSLEI